MRREAGGFALTNLLQLALPDGRATIPSICSWWRWEAECGYPPSQAEYHAHCLRIKLSASCKRSPMLCQINGNAFAIVYLKTAGGRWEKVRYLRLSWKRSLRPCREAGVEVGEPDGRADWICGGCRASWPRQPDLWKSASRLAEPTGSLPSDRLAARRRHSAGGTGRAWDWIACWATYQAWLASIPTKLVRIDALDPTIARAFHNARPCPTYHGSARSAQSRTCALVRGQPRTHHLYPPAAGPSRPRHLSLRS